MGEDLAFHQVKEKFYPFLNVCVLLVTPPSGDHGNQTLETQSVAGCVVAVYQPRLFVFTEREEPLTLKVWYSCRTVASSPALQLQ